MNRWSIVSLTLAKVQQTWRIQYDNAFYSVPYQHIGETATVLADSNIVVIYLSEKEIARHIRAVHDWEIKRSDHHAPPGANDVSRQTRESLLQWAGNIGEEVFRMSQAIFGCQGIDGTQSVSSLCHLAKVYGRDRLNLACKEALERKTIRYRDVNQILLKTSEKGNSTTPDTTEPTTFRFQREKGYYDAETAEFSAEVCCG